MVQQCREVHTSIYKGVTTVVRCTRSESGRHGSWHESVVQWYADVTPPENWNPGDVVRDARNRIFRRSFADTWWRPGYAASFIDIYPRRRDDCC